MKNRLVLLITTVITLNVNAQMKTWFYAPKKIQFQQNGQSPIVSNFCNVSNYANTNFNQNGTGAYDVNGNLHFYIYGNVVRSGSGAFIGNLAFTPNINQSEIAIVPFSSNGDLCLPNRHYIIYNEFYQWLSCPNNACWSRLRISVLTTDPLTNAMTLTNLVNSRTNNLDFAISSLNFPDDGNSGIAVGKIQYPSPLPTNGPEKYGYRYLYFASGNSIQRITLTEPTTNNNNGIGIPTTLVNTSTLVNNQLLNNVSFQTRELDLSPDGTMLAWGEYGYSTLNGNQQTNINKYNIIKINPQGNYIVNSFRSVVINSQQSALKNETRGVEFSADNNYLFVSTALDGIKRISLLDPSLAVSDISNSLFHSHNMIELAADGNLYVINNVTNNLDQINQSQLTMVNKNISIAPLQTCLNLASLPYPILPDQIDGEDITPFLYKGMAVDAYTYSLTSNAIWTINNPIKPNSTNLKINGLIYVGDYYNAASLTLRNITIEFGPEGGIVVQRGSKLKLENVTLKGLASCGNMWKGIVGLAKGIESWNEVFISADENTTIQDAEVGIEMNGTGSHLKTASWFGSGFGGTTFKGNGVDIRLKNIATNSPIIDVGTNDFTIDHNIQIGGSFMDNTPLINQKSANVGSSLGYSDGLKRTKFGIELINCLSNTIQIGIANFNGGQTAIYSNGGSLTTSSCRFANHKQQAVFVSGSTATIYIKGGEIQDCNIGLTIEKTDGATINVSNVNFTNMDYAGINITSCVKTKMNIGEVVYNGNLYGTGPSLGNRFNNCYRGINLYFNPSYIKATNTDKKDYGNEITINKNEITNCTIGIILNEIAGNERKYKSLSINDNVLKGVVTGIKLTNIVGGNPSNPKFDKVYQEISPLTTYPLFDIFNNTIENLIGNYLTNSIVSSGGGSYNLYLNNLNPKNTDKGVDVVNATNTLICKNYFNNISYGVGLNASAYMLGSNYYCNQFTNCGYGIHLTANHVLRVSGDLHGEPIVSQPYSAGMNRDNAYIHSTFYNSDIVLDPLILPTSTVGLNTADFLNNSLYNKWIYNLHPYVRSHYPIFGGHGADKCGYQSDGTGINPPTDGSGKLSGTNGNLTPYIVWMNENYIHKNYLQDTTGTLTASTNTEVVQLYAIEKQMEQFHFDTALLLLSSFTPATDIATDYKKVYTLFSQMQSSNTILNSSDSLVLATIASKNSRLVSPASYVARAILFNMYNIEFTDPAQIFYPNISGRAGLFCEDVNSNIEVYVEDMNQNRLNYTVYTNEDGRFVFDGDSLSKVLTDLAANYRIVAVLPDENKHTNYRSLNELYYTDHYLGCSLDKYGSTTNTSVATTNVSSTQHTTIRMYPNPANRMITITNAPADCKVRITNMLGQTLYDCENKVEGILTNSLPEGMYTVEVINNLEIKLLQQKLTILHE